MSATDKSDSTVFENTTAETAISHVGHACCPCVERLRAQNKASSDDWTKRTAKMQGDLYGLRSLMHEALLMHRKGHIGISAYGQAALAAALDTADRAEGELEAMREAWARELRERRAVQEELRRLRRTLYDAQLNASSAMDNGGNAIGQGGPA